MRAFADLHSPFLVLSNAWDEHLRPARSLRSRSFWLSVDIEGGFDGVDAYVAELGADGVNVEDGRADGTLVPVDEHCGWIEAI